MPYNLKSSIAVIKNIAITVMCLIILTACGLKSHDNANAPVDSANFALINCPIPSSSAARTAEYQRTSGLDAICASYAYDAGYTGNGQTVSLLDTPVFTSHTEFIDDNDHSAFAAGNNASCSHTCNNNQTYHGTHVAGIIGARKNTLNHSSNMHGVAYNAKIKAIAIFDQAGNGNGNTQTLANAINQGSGANIIAMNNSWGTEAVACVNYRGKNYYYTRPLGKNFNDINCETNNDEPFSIELNAWKNAVNKGTIVVFANGNHGLNSQNGRVGLYTNAGFSKDADPARVVDASSLFGASNANITSYESMYPEYDSALKGKWLNVIAVDSNSNITSFSNGCGVTKQYCIAAPGYVILGPTETNEWGYISGTSQAAPYVTGAIAVLKEAYPSMSSEEIVELILDSATDLGAPGTDNVYGRGMLNLRAAIQPIGEVTAVTIDNQSFGVPMNDTS
ncbi:MAG: S8 family serine peptidase, partial [Alphaproteobacteria bacterium]|nr:S8 family serine peptidase [Alphaproteobacteria bacterium]